MMNLVALSLVAASLAAASVWSPPPHPPDHRVIKEGRRVIVVEYEREGVEKPVLDDVHHEEHSFLPPLHEAEDKAKEKLKEAASVFPNIGQGVSGPGDAAGGHDAPGTTKEMICDAYGKCKEKISSVFGKAKDKASEAGEAPRETYEKAAEVGDEAARKAKRVGKEVEGKVQEKAKTARDEAAGAKKMAADKAKAIGEKVVEGLDVAVDKAKRVGESAAEKAKSVGEKVAEGVEGGAKMAVDKAKQAGESAAEKAKSVGGKLAEEVGGAAGKAKRMGEDIAGNLSEGLKAAVGARAKKNLTEIGRQAWEVAGDTWSYVASPESLRTVAGLVHLLAFSATYGTCMWVTFVSSHLLARSLARQQFGLVQSRIYPVYFRAMAYGVGLAWLAHLLSKKKVTIGGLSDYNLLATLGFVLANLLYMEPRASKVMFERLKLEKEEGKGRDAADLTAEPIAVTTTTTTTSKLFPDTSNEVGRRTTMVAATRVAEQEAAKSKMAKLNRRLKSLNTYSSFLNVLALMGLTWHLVYLARRLQMCS